ncbi:MAG: hypothetical protein ACYDCK_01315 [Thermoplasmatota archaeon]
MRASLLVGSVLLMLPFASLTASAHCEVGTLDVFPGTNYTTVCALDHQTFGDGTQTYTYDRAVHVYHATEADDPVLDAVQVFDDSHAVVEQGHYTYDDGTVSQDRKWTEISAGAFEGVRGYAGGGFQAGLIQRDQNAIEPEGSGSCSSAIGHSTCVGASAWLTVQDVASVGAGAYQDQRGSGPDCSESYEFDVDAAVVFETIPVGPGPCKTAYPDFYEGYPIRDLPELP